jgi:hypothetical protein
LFCNVYRPPELAYLFKNKTYLYLLWAFFFLLLLVIFSITIGIILFRR